MSENLSSSTTRASESRSTASGANQGAGGLLDFLFAPNDITGLVFFRIAFGVMMAIDSFRYVWLGWVHSHYLDPPFLLKFIGFQWVEPISPFFVYGVFGMMIASSLCIAAGWFYRTSCLLFCLGHTYVFLLAAGHYLNHAYLISVWAFLMTFLPAQRALSVDAALDESRYSLTIAAWPRWMLLGMLTVVYIYGGIAKINPDWLAGEPVRHWMADSARHVPAMGELIASEPFVWTVAYGGLAFDLLIAPMLLFKRTRVIGLILSTGFHLTNFYLFHIGVFPWFMLAATTLFLDPDWPRRAWQTGKDFVEAVETVGAPDDATSRVWTPPPVVTQRRIAFVLGGLFLFQILLPLRHHLYPSNVAWTEEGHYFSWRMKLRNKQGSAVFHIHNPKTGERWTARPEWDATPRQARKLTCRPDLLLQYAHHLRDKFASQSGGPVKVHADVFCSLNYRPRARLVDPKVDLAKEEHSLLSYDWLLPLTETLPARSGR